ncbi:DNA repair protein RecN [Tissierella sp. MSJ-40]|uniref:DNA repair protein RecN n=1 Tax=Tissierella simiarum TaxID=2841534 RepID=A0ABS6E572_9FIRM|nr:DNA repair protein RecN [Tissierella simiarum]MBU5437560.1 DNA repair protein RecN [Tissierella simiarum]
MLVGLNISNFAIIENLKVNFTKGLNVLTGETGSGKSIIIEAIGIILGGRSSKELVRTGCQKAVLEGVFYLEDSSRIKPLLDEYGIDLAADNLLIISREVYSNSPSISRINGRTVTLSMLNSITTYLVDIHGQHEHQSLLDTANHIKLIDSFGDTEFEILKKDIEIKLNSLMKEKKKLKDLSMNSIERDREIDLLRYQLEEIDNANLTNEDEEEIDNEYRKLSNIKEISFGISEIIEVINNSDYENKSIMDLINRNISIIHNLKRYDEYLISFGNVLENIRYELQDLNKDLRHYLDNINVDDERLDYLYERLNTVNKLKKKYGNTIAEILEYRESIYCRLEELLNNEKEIEIVNKNIEGLEKVLTDLSFNLSNKRKYISQILEERVTEELKILNMEKVFFKVNFEKNQYFSENGFDKIEFLISTNPGEELKPLSRIVSGGEMSRIMLAFKSILAYYDQIPTLIFDEIDTGISGRTAQIVGEKISSISINHQIICISHLPQIAALADSHFAITKDIIGEKTRTNIVKLSKEDRVKEMARLLGGVDLTDTTIKHAEEMIEMSKKIKQIN